MKGVVILSFTGNSGEAKRTTNKINKMNKTLLFTREDYRTLENLTEEGANLFAERYGIKSSEDSFYEDIKAECAEVTKVHLVGRIEDTPIYLLEYKGGIFPERWLSYSTTKDIELAAKNLFEDLLLEWEV